MSVSMAGIRPAANRADRMNDTDLTAEGLRYGEDRTYPCRLQGSPRGGTPALCPLPSLA